jgi:hypothetical protein
MWNELASHMLMQLRKYQMETFQVRILWTWYIYLGHKQKIKRISAMQLNQNPIRDSILTQ